MCCMAGVEHLLRDVKDATVSTLSTEVERMAGGLSTLKARLLEIQQYLELVIAGKLPVNHDIVYSLQVPPPPMPEIFRPSLAFSFLRIFKATSGHDSSHTVV